MHTNVYTLGPILVLAVCSHRDFNAASLAHFSPNFYYLGRVSGSGRGMWLPHRGHATPSLTLAAAPVSCSPVCAPRSGDPPPQPHRKAGGKCLHTITGKEEIKKTVNVCRGLTAASK